MVCILKESTLKVHSYFIDKNAEVIYLLRNFFKKPFSKLSKIQMFHNYLFMSSLLGLLAQVRSNYIFGWGPSGVTDFTRASFHRL